MYSHARKTTVIALFLVLVVVIVAVVVAVVLTVKSSPDDEKDDDGRIIKGLPQEPPYKSFAKAAVATDSGPCSEVGRDILREGSTADAAIASMFCLGLINMHSTGIGGGGFMVYYDSANQNATAYDFREEAPANATERMYLDNPDNKSSLIGEYCLSRAL